MSVLACLRACSNRSPFVSGYIELAFVVPVRIMLRLLEIVKGCIQLGSTEWEGQAQRERERDRETSRHRDRETKREREKESSSLTSHIV